jgi:DNA-binding SARP family transcriptional activator/tetratricopeptide (TPR) repeat protein
VYEFCLLGPLEVRVNGRRLELGGQKQRILLAMLLLEANRVVSSDSLIEAIWEEQPTATARKGLQVLVSQLRKLLGKERVVSRAPGYALMVDSGERDLDRFDALRAEGRVEEALALWRGAPLADFAYDRFAQPGIARLEELRLAALEDRIDADIQRGRHAELVGELEALVAEHPSRERLVAQLLLVLYRSGRQADALDAYREVRHTLVEELGIEPGPRLRELQQQILRQDPGLDLSAGTLESEPSALFVGREAELTALTAALEEAFGGRGRLILLEGEPGIGKSQLADEFTQAARRHGALVLAGRAWEAGGAPAYWPWLQALRGRELFPDVGQSAAAEPEAARFRLFDRVASVLRNEAERRPIVLFFDDLHAADASSLLLLQFVARELKGMHVLVLGAYRNVDPAPSEDLESALTALVREPVTHVLTLGGLSEEDVARYVSLARPELAGKELAAQLRSDTEGNPLFIVEVVRLLEDEEARGSRAIPRSVRSVIARRLAQLSDICRSALVVAAVLGREFTPGAVASAAELTEGEALELLDEALRAGVLSEVPDVPGRLRFAHVLIRDTLYEGETAAKRIGLHRRVVEALEALYGAESAHHLNELALHAVAGSEFERAISFARRGGDRALAMLAYEEAVRLYELALDALALSAADEERRCELLLALGDARTRSGDSAAAKHAFLEAAEIARRVGLPQQLAQAALGYGGRIVWSRAGGDERLVPLLEEALRRLGDEDVDLRVRLLARLSGALRDEPSRERRDELSLEAIELARRSGNASSLAYALGARGHAIAAPDTTEELLSLGTELCETARSLGDRERVTAGHAVRTLALLIRGDVRLAEREAAAFNVLAAEIKQVPQLWDAASTGALLALNAGRFAEAEALSAEALEYGKRALPDAAVPIHVLHEFALRDFRGGLERLEPSVRELVESYPARGVFRCALVYLYARGARASEAERELRDLAAAGFQALAFDQEWLFGMALLAEAAVFVSDAASAARLYPLLEPWGDLNAVDQAEGTRGSVRRYLGLLARLLERPDEAVAHFEAALLANERMGARPWLARTQEDFASLVMEREPERGRELLDAALAAYRELGMEPVASITPWSAASPPSAAASS